MDPITTGGRFDESVVGNLTEHLLEPIDQCFDIHTGPINVLFIPKIPDNLVRTCRAAIVEQQIHNQPTDFGRLQIFAGQHALGGDDLQFIKQVDDDILVGLDNLRCKLPLCAVHQPLFIYGGHGNKGHHLQKAAASNVPLGIAYDQKTRGPLPERNCNHAADTITFEKFVLKRRKQADLLHIFDDHRGSMGKGIDPAPQAVTFLDISKPIRGHALCPAVVPKQCRPDFHGQICIHDASPVAIIKLCCSNEGIHDDFFRVIRIMKLRFQMAQRFLNILCILNVFALVDITLGLVGHFFDLIHCYQLLGIKNRNTAN